MAERERDEMGRFVSSAREATEALEGLSRASESSARAAEEQTRSMASFLPSAQTVGSVGMVGAGAITSGLGGGLDAAVGNVTRAGIDALRQTNIGGVPVGAIYSEAAGLNRAERVVGNAADSVAGTVAELARYGRDVGDDEIQRHLGILIEQEEAAEKARRRVSDLAFTPENLKNAGANVAAAPVLAGMEGLGEAIKAIPEILAWIKRLSGSGGGGSG